MFKPALLSGALFAALAVVLGAFGAHGLKKILEPAQLITFEKGVTYQFYHAFALLAVGIIYSAFPAAGLKWATYLFIAGILMFSGSLYVLVALQHKGSSIGPAGIITPIGGLCFIVAWVALFIGIIKNS